MKKSIYCTALLTIPLSWGKLLEVENGEVPD